MILMIFGKNIAARAGTKNVLFFHTPNQCFCTTWQTPKSVSTQMLYAGLPTNTHNKLSYQYATVDFKFPDD